MHIRYKLSQRGNSIPPLPPPMITYDLEISILTFLFDIKDFSKVVYDFFSLMLYTKKPQLHIHKKGEVTLEKIFSYICEYSMLYT